MSGRKKIIVGVIFVLALIGGALYFLSRKPVPERILYGASFNAVYAEELGLDWRDTYRAILDELGVRRLRLTAQWDMVEPQKDRYSWSELDFQLAEARARGATVILGVGRRLPRWPECHTPNWAEELSAEEQKAEILEYIQDVVERYKGEPSIIYWQVENEPYLEIFAHEHCGDLDEEFLEEEIALVRSLDSTRPILLTDSGNLGKWTGAYERGDAFGTSVYVYFWNPELGQFRTVLPPAYYRVKERLMRIFHGPKRTFLIELSAEPWLIEPITSVPIETQYTRMNPEIFDEILEYARETRYETQYLWGAEWWYWLKEQGHPDMWERAETLIKE